jgi:BirA family biotin operon repressor/biotin-[acetyl-CoA-carboxylase] ligase
MGMKQPKTTKESILFLLESDKGEAISGEEIALSLEITRSAVWKAIKELQHEGHQIRATPKVGYQLESYSDVVSLEGVEAALIAQKDTTTEIVFVDEVNSTNTLAKKLALEGQGDKTVVIARSQSGGLGRNGRSFLSDKTSGTYISMILRPKVDPSIALRVTSAAAVATRRAIKEVFNIDTKIKWVNDLYLGEHKVAGILTESASGLENGRIESIVVGIGVNVYPPKGGFPQELEGVATSLQPTQGDRNSFIASLIIHLKEVVESLDEASFMKEYREHSLVVGRKVQVIQGENSYIARVLDISDEGSLVIEDHNQNRRTLHSGEISLRPPHGESW